MNLKKVSQFISEQRKANNLTEESLAEQLNVPAELISQWEQGQSAPDISLLAPLSKSLNVTIDELLNGEKADISQLENNPANGDESPLYSHRKKLFGNIHQICGAAWSACSLIGIVTCLICNLAISGNITWAWFPISSILFTWLTAMPAIIWGKKGIPVSLISFSVLALPFLFILDRIIGTNGFMMPISIRIAPIALIYLWLIYFLFAKSKLPRYVAIAITIFSAALVHFLINLSLVSFVVPSNTFWNVLGSLLAVITAIAFLIGGAVKNKKIFRKI